MTKFDERLRLLGRLGLLSFQNQADVFFKAINPFEDSLAIQGTLHLLRRDIRQCLFGENPSSGQQMMDFPALWPGAMGVLAGIDLLAKHYAGNANPRETGVRYKTFLSTYFSLADRRDDEVIYQLRNALLHSFGMYSKDKTIEYEFSTSNKLSTLVSRKGGDYYVIGLGPLYTEFEKAIGAYQDDLENDKVLQQNFSDMFVLYGWVKWRYSSD